MIRLSLKIAIRGLIKDWIHTVINFIGLTIALVAVLLIMAYVRYEGSYDRYSDNAERTYRIIVNSKFGFDSETSTSVPPQLANTLKSEFPEIDAACVLSIGNRQFRVNQKIVTVNSIQTDSDFLKIFGLPMVSGTSNCLHEDNSLVLTKSIVDNFYPDSNAIGNTAYNESGDIGFKITGIAQDIPENTHFNAQVIVSTNSVHWDLWDGHNVQSAYLMLKPGTNEANLVTKFSKIYSKYKFPEGITLTLQPVTSIHLRSYLTEEPFVNNSIKNIFIISLVALLILVIACINYINLTTTRSFKRAKEVGIKRVLGGGIRAISFQFITESVLFFLFCLPFTFAIATLLWPFFTHLVGIHASLGFLLNLPACVFFIVLGFIAGILSGLHPTYTVARFSALDILKGRQQNLVINFGLRKVLIVFQFSLAILLIIATVVIYSQLYYLNNVDLGFNKQNIISLPKVLLKNKTESLKRELLKNNGISNITIANWDIGNSYGGSSRMTSPGDSIQNWDFVFLDTDFDFLNTVQGRLIEGRFFSNLFGADMLDVDSLVNKKNISENERVEIWSKRSIVISKSTASALKLKNPVTGTVLKYGALQGTVIGVIEDFQGVSLLKKPSMVIIRGKEDNNWGSVLIRISSKDVKSTIRHVEKAWEEYFPGRAFSFSFVDERLQRLYTSQERLSMMFNLFAILSIVIAFLGLFSIVAIMTNHRLKEISIRRVIGAGYGQIIQLISADFLKLILIAISIGVPISWWTMKSWLETFPFRISIKVWWFPTVCLAVLVVAFIAISLIVYKAARTNITKNLRSE